MSFPHFPKDPGKAQNTEVLANFFNSLLGKSATAKDRKDASAALDRWAVAGLDWIAAIQSSTDLDLPLIFPQPEERRRWCQLVAVTYNLAACCQGVSYSLKIFLHTGCFTFFA